MNDGGSIKKCVLLARGLGSRMRKEDGGVSLSASQSSAASAGLKAMIPVGRPFLDYILSGLADAGFEQVCLVIGPEHDVVRDYYTGVQHPTRVEVRFAPQAEAIGTANALLAAEEFAGADGFISINADNYYPVDVLRALHGLGQPGTVLFEEEALVRKSNIPAQRIRDFAYAVISVDGFLSDLIEKPDAETAAKLAGKALISMNCWRFDPAIFPVCREVPVSPRGEFELPNAVRLAIQKGMKLKAATCQAGVLDLSRRSDIAAVAARLKDVQVEL
jgi:glucose-1-phosphate thymidylyltransferase